jgi:hypothetical protein
VETFWGNKKNRQCKYNIEARYHKKGCNGKAVSVTGSGCVFVALVIQHKMCMRHIVLSSVACPDVPYFSTICHDFWKKVIKHKMCFLVFSATIVRKLCHSKKNSTKYSINVCRFPLKYRYYCQILIRLEFSRQILVQYSNTKFYENLSSGSQVVECGQTVTTKLMVAFRQIVNAPKKTQAGQQNSRLNYESGTSQS